VQKILQTLLDLQNVDIRLTDVRARLAKFPKKLADSDTRVAASKAELDVSKAAQLATVKDRKKYELDVDSWKDKVRKYRDQTSQIKTNEAYRALQHEVQMAEDQIAKAEDRLLEQMVASEEYDRRIKASEIALKDVEAVERVQRSTVEADRAVAEKDLAELTAERTRAIADIPEKLLDHYDRIVRKHNGVALAEVRNEKCAACGMIVRPHVIQEMRRADSAEMFHCETCTRIIYYIESSATSVPPGSSASQASAAASTSHES
jgi:predicted  nucleic acid-binding Zn-ribbon protein